MKNNYRVVIAEDEPRILRNIIKKLGEADVRFTIESSAQDGVEALRLIGELSPDILFTDIVMPKMDGLELIEKALKICPDLHIVILSGFNNFSYAKQAIQFGIEDYLLKPLKNDDLIEILNSISEKINKKRDETDRSGLYDLIHQGKSIYSNKSPHKLDRLVLFMVCIGNYLIQPGEIPREDHQRYEQIWDKIEQQGIFPHAFGNIPCWFINGKKANQRYFLLEMDNQYKSKIPLYADKIKNLSSEYTSPYAVTVCYSEKILSKQNLYLEARKLRNVLRNGLIPSNSQLLSSQENLYPPKKFLHTDEEKKIILLADKGERIRLTDTISEILYSWIEARHPQLWIEKGMEHITRVIQSSLIHIEGSKVLEIMHRVYLSFARHSDIESVCRDFLDVIDIELLKKTTSLSPSGLVDKLEMYLSNQYSEKISLEQLSEHFGYEAAYLTRLYKKYKGETPIQTLTRIRIESACALMKDNLKLDIKEIGDIVGYKDHHYFSRVFKKLKGIAPSEYRQILLFNLQEIDIIEPSP